MKMTPMIEECYIFRSAVLDPSIYLICLYLHVKKVEETLSLLWILSPGDDEMMMMMRWLDYEREEGRERKIMCKCKMMKFLFICIVSLNRYPCMYQSIYLSILFHILLMLFIAKNSRMYDEILTTYRHHREDFYRLFNHK